MLHTCYLATSLFGRGYDFRRLRGWNCLGSWDAFSLRSSIFRRFRRCFHVHDLSRDGSQHAELAGLLNAHLSWWHWRVDRLSLLHHSQLFQLTPCPCTTRLVTCLRFVALCCFEHKRLENKQLPGWRSLTLKLCWRSELWLPRCALGTVAGCNHCLTIFLAWFTRQVWR